MHCSFCQTTTEGTEACNCEELLAFMRDINTQVEFYKTSPIRNDYLSPAEGFYSVLNRYSTGELKGIAIKLGVSNTSRLSRNMLKIHITHRAYYGNIPTDEFILNDHYYLNYLDMRISGETEQSARASFNVDHMFYGEQICEETRRHNIQCLWNFALTFTMDSPLFGYVMNTVHNGPAAIARFFGREILLEDVFDYVPYVLQHYTGEVVEPTPRPTSIMADIDAEAAAIPRVRNNPRLVIQCNFDKAFVVKSTDECAICYETTCNAQLNCKHEFCTGCIRKSIETVLQNNRRSLACPMCRADVDGIVSNLEEDVAGISRVIQMSR
jgi:hypothetical protein